VAARAVADRAVRCEYFGPGFGVAGRTGCFFAAFGFLLAAFGFLLAAFSFLFAAFGFFAFSFFFFSFRFRFGFSFFGFSFFGFSFFGLGFGFFGFTFFGFATLSAGDCNRGGRFVTSEMAEEIAGEEGNDDAYADGPQSYRRPDGDRESFAAFFHDLDPTFSPIELQSHHRNRV